MPEGVFTNMSKTELVEWITFFEEECPEDFWMDGECELSRDDRFGELIEWWPGMPPEIQQNQYDSLKDLKEEMAKYAIN